MISKRLLLGLPLVLYLLLPTRNYYWDGVASAIAIEKRPPVTDLLHPNHLIYAAWGSCLYKAMLLLGLPIRALLVMQAANGVLAGVTVLLMDRALRVREVSSARSMVGALVFAFSATWWRFATDANAYVPSVCLLLAAYCVIEKSGRPLSAGLLHAGAMLFHELAVLFLPVALLRLKDRRRIVTYLAASIIPVAVAYVLAYRAAFDAITVWGFLSWSTSHSPDSGFSFDLTRNVWMTARGMLRLFWGGRLGNLAPGAVSVAALIALLAALVVLAIHIRRAPLLQAVAAPRHLLVWLGINVAFLFFWMPQNTFYRLFHLPPLILIVFATRWRTSGKQALPWLCMCLMALWNFVFSVYPQSRVEHSPPLRFALLQSKTWPPGTPIVFHRFHPDLWVISYFNPQATWIGLDKLDLALLDDYLAYAREQQQTLWMGAVTYDLLSAAPAGRKWLAAHIVPDGALSYKARTRDVRFHQLR